MLDAPNPFQALPGTTPPPRALFLNRWGTLLSPPERGYAERPDEIQFYDGVLDALFRAGRADWQLYLVGNEDSVALGRLDHDAWKAVEERIQASFRDAGITIHRSYHCLEHPEGGPGFQKDSVYFLPNTGAFYHATHNDGISLKRSWVIGDTTLELVAGWRSGLRIAGVETGKALADATFLVEPEFVAASAAQAIDQLLALEVAIHP